MGPIGFIRVSVFVKNPNVFPKIGNLGKTSQFWSTIAILIQNRNFCRKSAMFAKIGNFFDKNGNLFPKSEFWQNHNFCQKSECFAQKSQF